MSSLPACTHILLDAALPELRRQWYRRSPHSNSSVPLYLDTPFSHLLEVSPIVASTSSHDPFLHWLIAERPTLNWGLLLASQETPEALAMHYRRWLTILNPQGDEVLFRFYDPDVLPHFLGAFDSHEYRQWFGPVTAVNYRSAGGFTARHAAQHPEEERVRAPLPAAPWWKIQPRHQQALRPLYRQELIGDTQQRLLLEAGAWLMHLDSPSIEARVADAVDRLTALNADTLPSRDEAAHFCLLAVTSCSHPERRDDFQQDLARHGLTATLANWQTHAYGKLPDRHHHDPAWLPEGPQMDPASREGTHS
ncbi:MAG: DUF4123 domain-containing protein [Halomonadaceae bacterium]